MRRTISAPKLNVLLEETTKRYCLASKKEKTKIIDEFTATTGYNRKYAFHVLKNKAVLHTSNFNNVKNFASQSYR